MPVARIVVAALATLALAAPAQAATILVTTTDDEFAGSNGSGCSLREAIEAANTDTDFGGCPAGNGVDTIRIPSGTYEITREPNDPDTNEDGDFAIVEGVAIVGAGRGATKIDAGDLDRLFYVNATGPSPRVTFSDLTMQHGDPFHAARDGGAIYALSPVTVKNVRFFENDAVLGGAIYASDALRVRDSAVTENDAESIGGGIYADDGTLTVSDTTIRGNAAATTGGGGIYSEGGAVTITRTRVTSNTAEAYGGGVFAEPDPGGDLTTITIRQSAFTQNSAGVFGGAINLVAQFASPLTASIEDSLLTRNRSGGYTGEDPFGFNGSSDGLHNSGAAVTIANTTITLNSDPDGEGKGGGIVNSQFGTMTLRNVTVTENRASATEGDGDNIWNDGALEVKNSIIGGAFESGSCGGSAPIISLGHNLEFQTRGHRCVSGATDRLGNPRLGALDSWGGPTRTISLRPGSAAVDRGSGCTSVDQRGAPRALGGRCDIGAYELVRCLGVIVNRVGTSGRDVLRGGPGEDGMLGLGGRDRLIGRGNVDALCGGGGNDTLIGGRGDDRLDGGPGTDACLGGSGQDTAVRCERVRSVP